MCFSAKTVLIKPATPAAASRCPIFVFTEPIAQNPFLLVLLRKALVNAVISIGSPRAVPVPCVSIYEIVSASISAFDKASTMASDWPLILGARWRYRYLIWRRSAFAEQAGELLNPYMTDNG